MNVPKSFSLLFLSGLAALGPVAPAQTSGLPPAEAAATAESESVARKNRSIARLKEEGVPVLPSLPVIADSARAKIRPTDEIARRAIAVCLAALKAERADDTLVENLVKKYKAKKFFTGQEAAFMDTYAPPNGDRDKFIWRYEALVVLMWSLGYLDSLDRPDHTCDVRRTVAALSVRTTEQLIADAKPRSAAEILDEADLIYRYHWAVADARRQRKDAPAGLDRGVVQQRHHALNWLISHWDQPWDSVVTDTGVR